VDVILEMLCNVNLSADLKMLATNGRVIIIGNRGEITINPRDLMLRRASARGFTLWAVTPRKRLKFTAACSPDSKTARFARSSARSCPSLKPRAPQTNPRARSRRKNRARTLAVQPDLLFAPDRGSCGPG